MITNRLQLFRRMIAGLLIVGALGIGVSGQAAAQAQPGNGGAGADGAPEVEIVNIDAAQAEIDTLKARLAEAAQKVAEGTLTDKEYAAAAAEALDVNQAAQMLVQQFQPRVQTIETQVKKLEPTDSEAEITEAAKLEADAQRETLGKVGGILQQAQVVATQSSDLALSINQKRREQFSERLFARDKSLVDPGLWAGVIAAAPRLVWRTEIGIERWRAEYTRRIDTSLALIFFAALVATIIVIFRSRGYILRRIFRDATVEPTHAQRVGAAMSIVAINFVAAAICSGLLFLFLDWTGSAAEQVRYLRGSVLGGFTLYITVAALAHGLFSPSQPNWRLVPVKAEVTRRLSLVAHVGGLLVAFGMVVNAIIDVLAVPEPIVVATHGILSIVIAVVSIIGLRSLGHREDHDGGRKAERSPWRLLIPFGWIGAVAGLVAPLFGYIELGRFMSGQLVLSALAVGLVYLLLEVIEQATTVGFEADKPAGRLLASSLGFSEQGSEQIGVLIGGLVKLTLIVFAVLVVLVPWGLTTSDIGRLENLLTQFSIGNVTISITTILSAIVIFAVGFSLTRAVQRWLENNYLPKTSLDVGLKTSILTGLGYVGIIAASMFAFSHLGVQMENLALVAGALSVGIGFGLQSVVSNFVSGLILLAERPIRTGDWVVVNGQDGTVRKINVRSTEIETFDRATVIVPNSDLISGVVTNWMLNDNIGRIIVPVGVDYSSDPEQVKAVLLDCARGHPRVLAYPEAFVLFVDFGESSLNFELRCYLSDIGLGISVRSDLRFEIAKRFREEGIEMPFPQRVVHLRGRADMPAEPAEPVPLDGPDPAVVKGE